MARDHGLNTEIYTLLVINLLKTVKPQIQKKICGKLTCVLKLEYYITTAELWGNNLVLNIKRNAMPM